MRGKKLKHLRVYKAAFAFFNVKYKAKIRLIILDAQFQKRGW